jgi:hypothetical protein
MPHHRIPPGQLLCRGPVGDPCQPPPPLIWQHRQIQLVSVQPAQIRQLLQLRLHPTRRRIRRALPQPGQGCTAQQRIDHQHRVQLRLPHRRDQMPHQIPRRRPGSLPGGRDALQHFDHTRAQHPRRHQVLARQPEQRRRRVVLHRPREQILGQFLPLHPAGPPPAQIPGDQHQMIRTGLLTLAVLAQRPHRKPQPLRQPRHRGRRRRDLVRHVPQPRHCAKLYGYPEHVLRPAEPPHELLVRRRQREIPEQLDLADLREPPQPRQLLLGEHIPGRHARRNEPPASDVAACPSIDTHCRLCRGPHPARKLGAGDSQAPSHSLPVGSAKLTVPQREPEGLSTQRSVSGSLGSWELPRITAYNPIGIGVAGTPWVTSATSCVARSRGPNRSGPR